MKVSLVLRKGSGNDRRYSKFNKKKIYPEGTVFCLRYQRKFETLKVTDQIAALAARAIKEAALLTGQSSTASAPAKRIGIDDAITVYLSNIAATKKHKTWLAYSRATSEFRESCTKQFMDEITKDDLTAFVIAQKKKVSDRTMQGREELFERERHKEPVAGWHSCELACAELDQPCDANWICMNMSGTVA